MIKTTKHLLLTGVCCLGLLVTGACTQDHESMMSTKRMEVHQEWHNENLLTHDLKSGDVNRIAGQYQKNGGDEPLRLTLQYDPLSQKNTAMNATLQASDLAGKLRKAGVRNVETEILPVYDIGDHSMTLVTYREYSAHAPSGCGMMPGLDNTPTDWKDVKKYGFGCTIESAMAKQIERPADLVGTADLPETSDGRRQANAIEFYRDGIPNEKIEGINSTDEN